MTQPNESQRSSGVTAAVLSYLDKHPNQVLHLNEIAEATGFEPKSVRSAINNIKQANKADARNRLKVELQGQAWVWRSGPIDGVGNLDELYVKAYVSKSGETLVEDEDGNLYKLVRI